MVVGWGSGDSWFGSYLLFSRLVWVWLYDFGRILREGIGVVGFLRLRFLSGIDCFYWLN